MQHRASVALLVTRIIIGGIFIYSGWYKVTNIAMSIEFFSQLGILTFLTYVVSYSEIVGGVFLIFGLWTMLTSSFLGFIVLAAIFFTQYGGFGSIGLPLATLAGCIAIFGSGPGKYKLIHSRFN